LDHFISLFELAIELKKRIAQVARSGFNKKAAPSWSGFSKENANY
jgi:hypothetical protein